MTNEMHKLFSMYLFYKFLHVSSTSCSLSGEKYCINTASGNSHSEAVLIQFASPDDEHDVLETCREL
jgi:hypothetical protein